MQTYKGNFVSTGLTVEEFISDNIHILPEYYKEAEKLEQFYEIVWELCNKKDSKHYEFFIKDGVVQEVMELEDLQYSNFCEVDEVTGNFVTSFYDGGTCLSEMLEKGCK